MEAAVERRAVSGERVPLDVLVELAHEDFAEAFEADGVNVGLGGLSMRAPYLPDVGQRLVCRFTCPPTGEVVEAGAEVVWAQDSGDHTGEFGLRFVEIDDGAHEAIRRMVSEPGGEGAYVPPAPEEPGPAPVEPPSTVELHLDGVSSPVLGRILHEDPDGMAVEQELPFLRLRTGLTTQDGRRGRIESVDLAVDGETPRLILDVSYDERSASFAVPEADATIPDFFPQTEVDLEAPEAHDTPFEMRAPEPGRDARVPEAGNPPADGSETVARTSEPGGRPSSIVFRTTSREVHEREVAEERARRRETETESDLGTAEGLAVRVKRAVAPALSKARADARAIHARIGPLLATLMAHVRRIATEAARRSGPWARKAWRVVRVRGGRLLLWARERVGRRFPRVAPRGARRRRTTAPPPRESNVDSHRRRRSRAVAVDPKRARRRTILVSILAASGVGLGVYALTPAEEEPEEGRIEVHRDVGAATPSQERGDPGPSEGAPATRSGEQATAAAAAGDVEPSVPTAMDGPSREAGPMPQPTFPSLREGVQPQDPESLPEGSPYAAAGAAEGGGQATGQQEPTTTFGASRVRNGRSFLIRMSRPVESIRGTRLEDGFRVHIPGSLSLDRAGPIAAAHAHVSRSMILNRGDHAELTIRFEEGSSPDYRVVARGSAVEVIIAR